ncbi:trypsin-like serine peptidase [Streptomyces sp. NPDC048603]|uniref:trypsin-like serine peptidase n=1 Tax=Streptomyces sp. NPDC048603 TaxID=3365577 RepID=UPI003723ACA4
MSLIVTLCAAAAAVSAAVLPVAVPPGAGAPGGPAANGWTATAAAAFWTPERMASARPVPTAAGRDESPDGRAGPGTRAGHRTGDRTGDWTGTGSWARAERWTAAGTGGVGLDRPELRAAVAPGIGQDFEGLPVVGRMFTVRNGGAYFCTASAVASPGRDLVLTAAHCLLGGDARQLAFVPRYTAARPQPYGVFPVGRIWTDPRYRSQGTVRAAALDFAFVQVGARKDGRKLQDVTGAAPFRTGAGYEHPTVRLVGHPAGAARPRLCVNRTTRFTSPDAGSPGSFLRIRCTGYPGGTSGGPFLTPAGEVIGIIGGYQTGGDHPDTSYSPAFGADARRLYEQAAGAHTRSAGVAQRDGIVS